MAIQRRQTKQVRVGNVKIGGNAPIVVQSMNNTPTTDVESTLKQIEQLAEAGCELTRLAVIDMKAAEALQEICARSPLPIVADIHFQYKLALKAVEAGVDALRINPGNIGSVDKVRAVAEACGKAGIPIRVGVNAGSLDPVIRDHYGGINADSLCASALQAEKQLTDTGFDDIVLSVKVSDPLLTIETYRKLAGLTDRPLHLGVTEAGTPGQGIIRSAVGIGTLLAEGIGDTIRVSLTADPVVEVDAAYNILRSLSLRAKGALLISCPTCGRTQVELEKLALTVEDMLKKVPEPIKVAVMGCPVNGPGEAKEADLGIAGGKGMYLIFRKGEIIRKVPETEALNALQEELEKVRAEFR